jgi:hypothetical protein
MPITITLQAASDSVMTEDGYSSGTRLADSDLRKVYGLPNVYVGRSKKIDKDGNITSISEDKLYFAVKTRYTGPNNKPVRWDEINIPSGNVRTLTVADPNFNDFPYDDDVNSIERIIGHVPPTTTAFQLRCDSISHDVDDAVAVSPLPALNTNTGARANSATPGQLINIVIGMGMRSEVIKLTGMLVDDGPISASNPRKQVLMNIARLQYLKSGRSGGADNWGGEHGGPLNPRSYPCLTIFDSEIGDLTTGYDVLGGSGVQPSGLNLSYRGIIKNLSFRQEGGRPNQWFWNMEFQVVANEHLQGNFISSAGHEGAMEITRIRLVNLTNDAPLTTGPPSDFPTDGGGSPARPDGAGLEIQVSNDLFKQKSGDETDLVQVDDWQAVTIANSNSIPPIDGNWYIYGVNTTNKTFKLINNPGNDTKQSSGANVDKFIGPWSFGEPNVTDQVWTAFQNGTGGYANFSADIKDGGSNVKFVDFKYPAAFDQDDTFGEETDLEV